MFQGVSPPARNGFSRKPRDQKAGRSESQRKEVTERCQRHQDTEDREVWEERKRCNQLPLRKMTGAPHATQYRVFWAWKSQGFHRVGFPEQNVEIIRTVTTA